MKKILLFILLFCSGIFYSQKDQSKLLKKAKPTVKLDSSSTTIINIDFWKDHMPTTDAVKKDFVQWAATFYSTDNNTIHLRIKPLKAHFFFYTAGSSKPKTVSFTHAKGKWNPDIPKYKLQEAPGKVVIEFEDTKNKKKYCIKHEGPFKVEEVY